MTAPSPSAILPDLAPHCRSPWYRAAREQCGVLLWWTALWLVQAAVLLALVHARWPQYAVPAAILQLAALLAPLAARWSLLPPRRAKRPPPSGNAPYADWIVPVRMLGRFLLYQEHNPNLSPGTLDSLRAAGADLHETLRHHPLSDDLERAHDKIRSGPLLLWKADCWTRCRPEADALAARFAALPPGALDPYLSRFNALWSVARLAIRHCMPDLLEQETYKAQNATVHLALLLRQLGVLPHVPLHRLAVLCAIEWSDFSLPWIPSDVVARIQALPFLGEATDAAVPAPPPPEPLPPPPPADIPPPPPTPPPPAAPTPAPGATINGIPPREGRSRRHHRHSSFRSADAIPPRHRRHRSRLTPDAREIHRIRNIFLTFAQRIRYTLRAWFLYR